MQFAVCRAAHVTVSCGMKANTMTEKLHADKVNAAFLLGRVGMSASLS